MEYQSSWLGPHVTLTGGHGESSSVLKRESRERMIESMYIGKVEKKDGETATILVKKVLPCGDNCRNCSAGCKAFRQYIQTEVAADVQVGNQVEISAVGKPGLKNSSLAYGLYFLFMAGFMAIGQFLPNIQNRNLASVGLGSLGLVIAGLIIKNNEKRQMKTNGKSYRVGKKISPKETSQ